MIISEESFLRRLPAALEKPLRVQLEAIVHAVDSLEWAYDVLQSTAATAGVREYTSREFAAAFGSAWSIVLQADILRQVIASLPDGMPQQEAEALADLTAVARQMRNAISHLGAFQNLAVRKGPLNPLFGAISYVLVQPEDFEVVAGTSRIKSATIIGLNGGAVVDQQSMPAANPLGKAVSLPVSLFQLGAFGSILRISDLVQAVEAWVDVATVSLEKGIRASIEQLVSCDASLSADELMAHPGVRLVVYVTATFTWPADGEGVEGPFVEG